MIEEYKVQEIVNTRCFGKGKKLQYLIQWKGYPPSEDLWINHKDLHVPEVLKGYYSNSTTAGQLHV